MNLVYGEIIKVSTEDSIPVGRIRMHRATKKIPLEFLTDAIDGDRVLICDGVAIGKVARPDERVKKYVPGDSWKAH